VKLAEIRKFLGAAAGAAAVVVSAGLLDGTAEKWTTGLIAAATAFVVYLLPNDEPGLPRSLTGL
jgi:hypothetical protein